MSINKLSLITYDTFDKEQFNFTVLNNGEFIELSSNDNLTLLTDIIRGVGVSPNFSFLLSKNYLSYFNEYLKNSNFKKKDYGNSLFFQIKLTHTKEIAKYSQLIKFLTMYDQFLCFYYDSEVFFNDEKEVTVKLGEVSPFISYSHDLNGILIFCNNEGFYKLSAIKNILPSYEVDNHIFMNKVGNGYEEV
ncbi:hypothetical protein [Bacillus sp. FJAT-27245]|uniref:hypothetical protein n=1 Tax=Bacillus sp. FJAT-27245 TaxID=1684144 RepID=UPI0006A7D230|nr:hypothetical protein [Bacillus sp. FJAT-27245]